MYDALYGIVVPSVCTTYLFSRLYSILVLSFVCTTRLFQPFHSHHCSISSYRIIVPCFVQHGCTKSLCSITVPAVDLDPSRSLIVQVHCSALYASQLRRGPAYLTSYAFYMIKVLRAWLNGLLSQMKMGYHFGPTVVVIVLSSFAVYSSSSSSKVPELHYVITH